VTVPDTSLNSAGEDRPAAGEPCEPDRPPVAGRVTNLVTAAAVIALGGAALAGSFSLGLGRASTPRPGTWPMLVSAALIVLGLVLALRTRNTDAERFTRAGLQVLAAIVTMIVYVAVVGRVGFEIPTVLLAFSWMRFFGRESWRLSIVASVAITTALYAVFIGALNVTIPHLL
jgi:hypothetical protein